MTRLMTLLALLGCTGCLKINYVTTESSQPQGRSHEVWRHRVLLGIIEVGGPLMVQDTCPQGFNYIHTELSVLNILGTWALGMVIPGVSYIYNPSTITVWCNDGQGYQREGGGDGQNGGNPQDYEGIVFENNSQR